MIDSDDEESRLYIDESITSLSVQCDRSTITGNPFELDPFLLILRQRYQTRSAQTQLTSKNDHLLFHRHRSTSCRIEDFQNVDRETNTEKKVTDDEETIDVVNHQLIICAKKI